MNLLIVGGAGHVGTILRPALEKEHRCRYLDRHLVPDAGENVTVGDVNDPAAIAKALGVSDNALWPKRRWPGQNKANSTRQVNDQEQSDIDALIYLAMGTTEGNPHSVNNTDVSFAVNAQGLYSCVHGALVTGVKRFVYASSLSVYDGRRRRWQKESAKGKRIAIDESVPTQTFSPYGVTKRLGEVVLEMASRQYPDATFVIPRLFLPRSEEYWNTQHHNNQWVASETGPQDIRQLFLKAIECQKPGAHIVHASGKPGDTLFPHDKIKQILDWQPQGQ